MTAIKTKVHEASVADYLAIVEPEQRRDEGRIVVAMIEEVSGEPAKMWGPSIIGVGSYHYRYESGHEGDMCAPGFSPRKAQLVFYLAGGVAAYEEPLTRLGTYKTGKGCLYIPKLSAVDMAVLEEMLAASWATRGAA